MIHVPAWQFESMCRQVEELRQAGLTLAAAYGKAKTMECARAAGHLFAAALIASLEITRLARMFDYDMRTLLTMNDEYAEAELHAEAEAVIGEERG